MTATDNSRTTRLILAWCAQAILILALERLTTRLVTWAAVGHVPVSLLAWGTMIFQLGILLGSFAWFGWRGGRARWWEGATAVAMAVGIVLLVVPTAIMAVASMLSGELRLLGPVVARLASAHVSVTLPFALTVVLIGFALAWLASRRSTRRSVPDPGAGWAFAGGLAGAIALATVVGSVVAVASMRGFPASPGMAPARADAASARQDTVPRQYPMRNLEGEMRNIMTLQEIHYAREGYVYAADSAALGWRSLPGVRLDIAFAGTDGWAGSVTDIEDGRSCAVAVGSVPDEVRIPLVGDTRFPGTPVCKP